MEAEVEEEGMMEVEEGFGGEEATYLEEMPRRKEQV